MGKKVSGDAPHGFMLVVSDADKNRLSEPSAYEIAMHRLRARRWGLGARTPHRGLLVPGSKLIIYTAGKRDHGGCLVGSAEVAARPERKLNNETRGAEMDRFSKHLTTDFEVRLRNCKIFRCPVALKDLRSHMSFVKNPDSPKWGNRLQTGAIALTKKDLAAIAASEQRSGSKSSKS
jgi:hypothetical protein